MTETIHKSSSRGWRVVIGGAAVVAVLWGPVRYTAGKVDAFQSRRPVEKRFFSPLQEPALVATAPTEIRPASAGTKPVTFRLSAPKAKGVFLGGDFNEFNGGQHPLERGEDGVWSLTLSLAPGTHTYKFKVDGQWQLDPSCPEKTDPPRERSVIHVE